ncbi:MarR family winged helix-turn-helix transcriptional regulator [Hoeflea sp. WL0058]|uniref:MarR family winged helix-turn-helix transcriptional regulator n=1 Tax=Flavimaribacter sediminis TaxID=2865987 RepID=A0AAE3D458_9HYPH|nr:MarR family winged helix-turn-helix transcriptional regulator [Flavimaribacter sediminis]MBW8640732.1 MarR family winged helix-turn-helix transcriptional regulator [Flavimaribacter sediminis]
MNADPLENAFNDCLLMNTIRTARILTRRYDNRIRSFGVTVVQFSVLMTIRKHPGEAINTLAGRIAMDRSTLTRNIDVMVRKGLVRKVSSGKGNARICRLTPVGESLLDELIPQWFAARQELKQRLGDGNPEEFLRMLRVMGNG